MKRTLFIVVFLATAIGGFAALASDETVAVLKTSYTDINSGVMDEKASMEFHTALVEGVEQAGYTVISGEVVATAVANHAYEGDCDRNCLNAVRSELGVSEVVRVQVREDDIGMATRSVAVTFAIRDDITKETSDGYQVVKTWLRGAVALALKESISPPQPTLMPETNSVDEASKTDEQPEGVEGDTTVEVIKDRPLRKIRPIPLIVSASLTVGFGAATIVMDSLAHRNYLDLKKDYDDGNLDASDQQKVHDEVDKINNQKLMMKIFLGATAAGLITTGIFAVFTDFSGSKKESLGLRPAFAVGQNSGALIIGGSF